MAINNEQVRQITSLSPMLLRGNAYLSNNTARYEFPPKTVDERPVVFSQSYKVFNELLFRPAGRHRQLKLIQLNVKIERPAIG